MPCFAVRTTVQTLENIPDINLLAKALQEMGFTTRVIAQTIAFSGVYKPTGQWHSGSYEKGKITTEQGIDLKLLADNVAKANVEKQIEEQAQDKYKKCKITIKWTSDTEAIITKQ